VVKWSRQRPRCACISLFGAIHCLETVSRCELAARKLSSGRSLTVGHWQSSWPVLQLFPLFCARKCSFQAMFRALS